MQDIIDTFRKDLFAGQTVLVSGATSGIGLAIAEGFARMGASVVATGTSSAKIEAARGNPSLAAIRFEQLDVRDRVAIDAFVPTLGTLSVLVSAAGIVKPDDEFNEDAYMEVIDVNMNSAMRLAMAAYPLLKESKGVVINTASMLSYLADDRVPAYCASKTGVVGLTRALAHKMGPDGIRVNAIAPGYHKTSMTEDIWSVPDLAARIVHRTAMKRWGTVDDLVGICLFLASPAAGYITGTTLPIDGGYVNGGW